MVMQRVCDACGGLVEQNTEHVEVTVEGRLWRSEHFHDECVDAGNLAERLRVLLDGDTKAVKAERRTW